MIEKLKVSINFGSDRQSVGSLAKLNGQYFFTYDADFPSTQLRLSPFKLPADLGIAHKVSL